MSSGAGVVDDAHEVAHVRTGDHLFLGLGSPFVVLVTTGVGQT